MVDFDGDEGFISEAEHLVNGETTEKVFSLGLEADTILHLYTSLSIDKVKTSILDHVFERSPTLEVLHPESMISVLIEKFKKLVGEEEDKRTRVVDLSEREAGFVNEKLACATVNSKQYWHAEGDDPETKAFINDVILNSYMKNVPIFREFNFALLEAGGLPHPKAFLMFDDLILP